MNRFFYFKLAVTNIKKNAKAALKQILKDPDYQFVTDHEGFLGRIQTACMRVRPDEVTGRVRKLQEAIENNDFPGMRRYADSDPVIAAAAVCRAVSVISIKVVVVFSP